MEACYFPKEFVVSQSHLYKKVAEPGFEPRSPQLQGSYFLIYIHSAVLLSYTYSVVTVACFDKRVCPDTCV